MHKEIHEQPDAIRNTVRAYLDAERSGVNLDSLGFAVLVTRLEERLGYDPFSLMDEAVYPATFREFVEVYERFAPDAPSTT